MHKSLQKSFRDNLLLLSLILAVIFAGMNIILYLINQSYLDRKIEEENSAFLELTTHLINENDVAVGLEYIEHYTHIHAVEVEMTDEDDVMLFSSSISYRYSKEYQIETTKGSFTVYMDNTDSTTVLTVNQNFIYVNLTLFVIYVLAIVFLYFISKSNASNIQKDVSAVLQLMEDHRTQNKMFQFHEFDSIYHEMKTYLEQIDLLQEQKEINIKALAHDIKTPLTIVYGYLDHIKTDKKTDPLRITQAFNAAQSINLLVNDLIQENFVQVKHPIALDLVIDKTIKPYKDVFATKKMIIQTTLDPVQIEWNEQDVSRIIENICSNAFHYSKDGTTLTIALEQQEHTRITFTSIPKDINSIDINHIFQKGFTQSNDSSKGLGLYICKLLLAPINGSISANTNENEFIITILI